MRNKSILVLIEHMVMLLVFALAAAVCLRMFALSGKLSRTYEATDRAVLAAQNAAELIKKDGIGGFAELTGAKADGEDTWTVFYDENWETASEENGKYVLRVSGTDTSEYLFRAEVVVFTDTGEELFRLPVAGQCKAEVTVYEEV